jgi:hypothetical protein
MLGAAQLKANLATEEVQRSKADGVMFVAQQYQEKLKRNSWFQGHTLKILMGVTLSSWPSNIL